MFAGGRIEKLAAQSTLPRKINPRHLLVMLLSHDCIVIQKYISVTLKNTVAVLYGYIIWIRGLPQATELMFAARTPSGRSVKMFLFGLGLVLPLGLMIWILLFWHGKYLVRSGHPEIEAR